MNKSRLFFGAFLVTLGGLVLLDRAGIVTFLGGDLWKFWPLLLVFLGGSVLGGTGVVGVTSSLLAGVALGVVTSDFFAIGPRADSGEWADEPMDQEIVAPWSGGSKTAHLTLKTGVASVTLDDTTSSLMAASVRSSLGPYNFTHDSTGGTEYLELELSGGHRSWRMGGHSNTVRVRLNPVPTWTLEIGSGVSKLDLDLRPFAVDRLTLSTGASSVRLRLGGRAADAYVSVKTGVSSVRIEVPEDVGCVVEMDARMSSRRLPGFTEMGSGRWETENYSSAERRITLEIEAGVSRVQVLRSGTSGLVL